MSHDNTESADWAMWLDRFEREIWPLFESRGFARDTAAVIYFTRIPESAETGDDDDDDPGPKHGGMPWWIPG